MNLYGHIVQNALNCQADGNIVSITAKQLPIVMIEIRQLVSGVNYVAVQMVGDGDAAVRFCNILQFGLVVILLDQMLTAPHSLFKHWLNSIDFLFHFFAPLF